MKKLFFVLVFDFLLASNVLAEINPDTPVKKADQKFLQKRVERSDCRRCGNKNKASMNRYGQQANKSQLESVLLGEHFPSFELDSLLEEGTQITEQEILGKAALVNIWSTWDPGCKQLHSYLNQLSKLGVLVYGVNFRDDEDTARRWLSELNNPYTLIVSDPKGKLGFDLGVYGAPETFVIDRFGVIHMRHVGEVNEQVWAEKIGPLYERLVAEQEQQP